MMHRFPSLFIASLVCLGGLRSQEMAPLSPAERAVLSLISSDSLSTTVVYFSRQMKFGITDQDERFRVWVTRPGG